MSADNHGELLLEDDLRYLQGKQFEFQVIQDSSGLNVIITNFAFPTHYTPATGSLLIILPAGYPNANPDMFWTIPDVKLQSGAWPQACAEHEQHAGMLWQRWSRHFQIPWRPNVDGLHTFVACIKKELRKGI